MDDIQNNEVILFSAVLISFNNIMTLDVIRKTNQNQAMKNYFIVKQNENEMF